MLGLVKNILDLLHTVPCDLESNAKNTAVVVGLSVVVAAYTRTALYHIKLSYQPTV